jgi:hypothetical protein
MPVLTYKYISNWFHLEEFMSGRKFIFKNWNENQTVPASDVELIQGSIGPHVKNIGGSTWSQSITTPVVIFENFQLGNPNTFNSPEYGFTDVNAGIYNTGQDTSIAYGVLDLLTDYWQSFTDGSLLYANDPSTDFLNLFLIESANLKLDSDTSTVTMKFKSDRKGPFSPVLGSPLPSENDFIGRLAKPWDVTIQVGSLILPAIISMDINMKLVIEEHWFMFPGASSTSPFFSVKGYSIEGSVTGILDASQLQYLTENNPNAGFDPYIINQVAGSLFTENVPIVVSYNTLNNSGNFTSQNIVFSSKSANTSINKVLSAGSVAQVSFDFSCFARPNGIKE